MSSSSPSLTFLRSGLRIIAGKIPRIAERLLGGLLIIRASTYRASPLIGHSNPLTPGENGYEQHRLCTHNGPLHLRLMSGRVISGCLAYRTLVRDLVYPESLYKSISNTIPNTILFTPPCSPRSSTQRVLFINIGKPLISEYRQCKEQAYFSLTYNNSP